MKPAGANRKVNVTDTEFPYLAGYPERLRDQVRELIRTGALQERLEATYSEPSKVVDDAALRPYVMEFKNRYLKRSAPLSRIRFDDKLSASHGALGLHSYVSRVQGARTVAKNEMRISGVFRRLPEPFLRMVVVHELAHLREKEHNKSFYQLCCHMEPDYHQLEFDLRLYLTLKEHQ